METQKVQLNFEIVGLITQNCLKMLVGALKTYYARRVIGVYALWKNKTIFVPRENQAKVKNSMRLVQAQVCGLKKNLQGRVKRIAQDVFLSVCNGGIHRKIEIDLEAEEQRANQNSQIELQGLNKELAKRQIALSELEKILKKLKSREERFKGRIQEISNKKLDILSNRKKIAKEKEEEVIDRIEELKEENSALKEKIEMIENNINNFMSEMGGLLELSEESQKVRDRRKTSVKKIK